MQVRQVYINGDKRTRVMYGSAGELSDKAKLKISFDAMIDDNATAKSIVFIMSYNEIEERYEESQNTAYAIIENDLLKLYLLNSNNMYDEIEYSISDNNALTLISGISPSLTVNGIKYIASEDGRYYEYHHSKFVNDECEDKVLTSTIINNVQVKENVKKEDSCTYAKGIEAIRQYLLQHLSVMKHELWYDYEYGLPLTQSGLTKAMIDAEVALIIYECPGIDSIESFESHVDDNHEYHLSFVLLTIYGKLEMIDTL